MFSKHLLKIACLAFAILALSANVAQAAGITVVHQIVSQQAIGASSDITIKFRVTNNSAVSLTPAALQLVDPMLPTLPGGDVFHFDALAAGEEVIIEWLVHSAVPMFPAGSVIQLNVAGVDAAGQTVTNPVTSLEEVLQ